MADRSGSGRPNRLADLLYSRQESLLEAWAQRVKTLSPARALPLSTVIDHLPRLFAKIVKLLEGSPADLGQDARLHAADRLDHGFDLDEVVRDYSQLRRCILDLWETEVGAEIPIAELRRLDAALDQSITESTIHYAKTRARMLTALDRISDAALGRTDTDTFLRQLITTTLDSAQAVDSVAVLLIEGRVLRPRAVVGFELGRDLPLERADAGFAAGLVSTREPAQLSSSTTDLARFEEIPSGTRAVYGVPLIHSGGVIGVIQMGSRTAFEFSDEDMLLFRTMASRATATIIQSASTRKHAQVEADLERTLTITQLAVRAREDLLAIVSHDLRNPLSSVVLNATLIRKLIGQIGVPDDTGTSVVALARGIITAAAQMERLIHDLIDLAKMEAGQVLSIEPTQQDVAVLVRQSAEILRPLADARQLTLGLDVSPTPLIVMCDAGRILQVLSNLVGNAIKFTREGGSISLRAQRSGREIVCSVSDTGVGISADELPLIFDPYWQALPSRRSGLGLGLSVAKGIVEAHRGRIWAESTPGRGSTFTFALPELDAAGAPAGIVDQVPDARSGEGR